MEHKDILNLLEESGLGAYKERLSPYIFTSAKLHLQPEQEDNAPVGVTKVGGRPDLPEDFEWPRWKKYNLSFIAQVNLSEMPKAQASPLPCGGLLSFFYAVEALYEYDAEFYGDPRTCRVIYTGPQDLMNLKRRELPSQLAQEGILKPNRVTFTADVCVPAPESAYLESMGLGWNGNQEEFEKYWSVFLQQFMDRMQPGRYVNRLLGHPEQIQGDMQVWCEMMTEGTYHEELNREESKRMADSALRWRLLLQIDSEEEKTGIMWGDVGRIYFWIREDDLAACRFDRAVCIMQDS
ncbi:YwqG family protein [Paenibacillus tarimensis]|uniref:YwqG family protein n=1 Tax=Paenibacillus tarimensis TaxID=416012 RepID=UPI001F18E91B|nr:YwqG family protein [Paenibacillus tarimensis]MCF2943357.1 DUF1963 domain-containing protein [Paenibacillus tarimensis]